LIGAVNVFINQLFICEDGRVGYLSHGLWLISASGSMIVWILSISTLLSGIFLMTDYRGTALAFSVINLSEHFIFQQVKVLAVAVGY
jgi:hypothetical protein